MRHHFTGLILHKGLAEKYHETIREGAADREGQRQGQHREDVTVLARRCSVDYAVRLGADAVGYTLYVGSPDESRAMEDFRQV